MVDEEVESILREIRERVLTTEVASPSNMGQSNRNGAGGNGAGDSAIARNDSEETTAADTRGLIDSYLTTTARAWDQLPPLVSNRTGTPARLELWVKRHLKRATRWFTWEQVNFNAAVHHAIRDTLKVLSEYEQAVKRLRSELRSAEAQRTALEDRQAETNKETNKQRAEFEARTIQVENRLSEQISNLVTEMRERDEHLQDEQRVCFKQLSLETSETAVLEDRARRKAEALLEELTRRVEKLESRKSRNRES